MIEWLGSMTLWDWFVQGIGIVGAILGVASFQRKTQQGIVLFQLSGNVMWTLHFLLLGAAAGGILNGIAILRGVVFYFRAERKWAASPVWYAVFIAMFTGAAIFSWWQGDGALALLPLGGMIFTTVSLALRDPFLVRVVSFGSSPCWLTYNIINFSIPGIATEIFAMTSIIVGVLRIDLPRMRKKKE